jgi:hypothetical protein
MKIDELVIAEEYAYSTGSTMRQQRVRLLGIEKHEAWGRATRKLIVESLDRTIDSLDAHQYGHERWGFMQALDGWWRYEQVPDGHGGWRRAVVTRTPAQNIRRPWSALSEEECEDYARWLREWTLSEAFAQRISALSLSLHVEAGDDDDRPFVIMSGSVEEMDRLFALATLGASLDA